MAKNKFTIYNLPPDKSYYVVVRRQPPITKLVMIMQYLTIVWNTLSPSENTCLKSIENEYNKSINQDPNPQRKTEEKFISYHSNHDVSRQPSPRTSSWCRSVCASSCSSRGPGGGCSSPTSPCSASWAPSAAPSAPSSQVKTVAQKYSPGTIV